MKIYIGHSTGFDYKKELYQPLRSSALNARCEIIFPHESSDAPQHSKEVLRAMDYFIAEVSFPSTGLGIELGWADDLGIPIIAVYKTGCVISGSIPQMTQQMIEYDSPTHLIAQLIHTLRAQQK